MNTHAHIHTQINTQKILNFVFYFWGTVWERECKDRLLPGHSFGGTSLWSQPVLWQCGKSEPLAFHPCQRHLPLLGVPLTSVFSITDITMLPSWLQHFHPVTAVDCVALCPQKRGCLLGMGGRGGRVRKSEGSTTDTAPKKVGEAVDCHQHNGSVKAVSPRHCAATSAQCNCCLNCRAGQSQWQCLLHCYWGATWSERSPTSTAQLLPVDDLFWADLKIQLHLPLEPQSKWF